MNDTLCRIFDLCLAVPFPVGNELRAPDGTPVDVHVMLGQVPDSLTNAVHQSTFADVGISMEVDERANVLIHTETARFYVVGGHTVLVDSDPVMAPHALRAMIVYHCVPVLLNQRGALAIHANAIYTPRGAIVLSGFSGGGKSTLHAALLGRGMAMLSDDVAVLRRCKDGYEILPGTRRYSMTADAWKRMQPPVDRAVPLKGPRKKVALLAPAHLFHHQPTPLAALYVIEPYTAGNEIVVERLQGVAAFQPLQTQTYLPLGAIVLPQHMDYFSELVESVAIYRIRRPAHRWTVEELADIVLQPDPLDYIPAHG